MLLVLRRSPAQEVALNLLLNQQQTKLSPYYHKWLTPDEFGQQFGPSEQDINTVTSWLESQGLSVNRISKGRVTVEFSGTAGQVKAAFDTEIHKYLVNGHEHWANSSDPKIPTDLTPLVAGVVTLHNFPRKPMHRLVGVFSREKKIGNFQFVRPQPGRPMFTTGGGCGLMGTSCYALSPYDFATIYNVLPLWNAEPVIDGTGQSIAIVGQSDIYPQDVSDFRSDFGLPPPKLNIIQDGPDPGHLATEGDELESDLDVEWSGAVAKGATIDFVISASTNSSAGVDLSALYIVDNNVAPIMSESYGACELDMGTAGNQFYNQLWQQAAAEGITVFVSTGDSGSAVCDRGYPIATHGLAVNGIASTPYNVAVGGTDFNDSQSPSTYWNSSNDPVTQASAKSYIPETTWNDTCTNSEYFAFTGSTNAEGDCNNSNSNFWPNFLVPAGASGGASNCTISENQDVSSCSGGYDKPSWQTGPGVLSDNKRDVPDVSLFAGDGMNANFYVVCETDIYGGCAGDPYNVVALGGTSASAPTFAGIMAMVNQGAHSRQGNANVIFYPLAAQPDASCNSSGPLGSSCIFYDVTAGTIAMPCTSGSPNCATNVNGDQNGILAGYDTTAGYDAATGLGSVNAFNLVTRWDSVSFQPTVSTLSLNPTNQIKHGSPVNVKITVAPEAGAGTPTGPVTLLASSGSKADSFALADGSVSATSTLLPGGSYTVMAHYAGDGTFAASDSSPGIPVTVLPESSLTTIQAFTLDQNGNSIPFTTAPYGAGVIYLQANVAGKSGYGTPTGNVNFEETLNGSVTEFVDNPYSLNSEGYTMSPLPGGYYNYLTPGAYSIAADYKGDASFNSSSSKPINFTVTRASTNAATNIMPCSLQTGPCTLILNTQIFIYATVVSDQSPFSDQPTGTMTFYSNGVALAPPIAVDSSIDPPIATFSTTQLPLGQNVITVQFSGDGNFSGSTSPATSINVITTPPPPPPPPTFTMIASSLNISVASPGKSGSTTLTFDAQNGFDGSATLSPSMCSNLPSESTCSFSPSNVSLTSSNTTASVTLTIATTASGSLVRIIERKFPRLPMNSSTSIAWVLAACILLASTSQRRLWPALRDMLCVTILLTELGCGSGGGGGGTVNVNPGTPVGNYTGVNVTVTMSGTTQTINNLSVSVQ